MDLLRTPDERFTDLPDWPFEPRYADVAARPDGTGIDGEDPAEGQQLRMAFVDEGPPDGDVVLLLHGEPSWSYLYRFMIPPLVDAGHRVIAPDLVGFGRSDKPVDRADHSYAAHVEWLRELLLDRLGLSGITLFCQDWGGLIGLRILAEHPSSFARVVVANTGLPTGHQRVPEAFEAWQTFSQTVETFPVGTILQGATVRELDDAEVAAYDAPFPDETFKAGPRVMPALVPTTPEDPATPDNIAAWTVLETLQLPLLTTFSDTDPITKGGHRVFQERVPGAGGRDHRIVHGGHFLQEDAGTELAELIRAFMAEDD